MSQQSNAPQSRQPQGQPEQGDPQMQGEGNYTAARRHRESAEQFVQSGQVDQAAHDAAPESKEQAEQMNDAEREGRRHARG